MNIINLNRNTTTCGQSFIFWRWHNHYQFGFTGNAKYYLHYLKSHVFWFLLQTIMDFKNTGGDHYPALLPVRSVAIMSGDCRYLWTHGMTPRVSDVTEDDRGLTLAKRGIRTSFTFRKVRMSPCSCGWYRGLWHLVSWLEIAYPS